MNWIISKPYTDRHTLSSVEFTKVDFRWLEDLLCNDLRPRFDLIYDWYTPDNFAKLVRT